MKDYDPVPPDTETAKCFTLSASAATRAMYGYEIRNGIFNRYYDRHPKSIVGSSETVPCIIEIHSTHRTSTVVTNKDVHLLDEFAECNSPDRIVAFARKHGLLMGGEVRVLDQTIEAGYGNSALGYSNENGESLSFWEQERDRLSRALIIYKASVSSDQDDFLRQHIKFADNIDDSNLCKKVLMLRAAQENSKDFSDDDPLAINLLKTNVSLRRILYDGEVIAADADEETSAYMAYIPWENYKTAATFRVFQLINQALDEYPAKGKLRLNLDGKPTLQIVSNTTLSKLWLLFAEILTGTRHVKICQNPNCNGLIEVPSGGSKRKWHDRCGDKMNKLKRRAQDKADACKRIENGEPIEEVAASVGKNPGTIKRWMEAYKL